MNKLAGFGIALGVMVSIVGCGPGGPKTVPAEGTITMGGQPLANAGIVVTYPDKNVAQGGSDEKGRFSLTYSGKNGAVAGTALQVSVIKVEGKSTGTPELPTVSGPPDINDRGNMDKLMEKMKSGAKDMASSKQGSKSLIDTKYNSPSTSGLTLTIPPSGSKDLKIDLQ